MVESLERKVPKDTLKVPNIDINHLFTSPFTQTIFFLKSDIIKGQGVRPSLGSDLLLGLVRSNRSSIHTILNVHPGRILRRPVAISGVVEGRDSTKIRENVEKRMVHT